MTDLMRLRSVAALAAALVAASLIAACGDDSSTGAERAEGEAVTAREAIAEIGAVRRGLAAALAAYEEGEAERAERLAGDAYLEHFELVEAPLEERDAELTEELEELIREQIRGEIEAGAAATDVARLIREADRELDEAEEVLRG